MAFPSGDVFWAKAGTDLDRFSFLLCLAARDWTMCEVSTIVCTCKKLSELAVYVCQKAPSCLFLEQAKGMLATACNSDGLKRPFPANDYCWCLRLYLLNAQLSL